MGPRVHVQWPGGLLRAVRVSRVAALPPAHALRRLIRDAVARALAAEGVEAAELSVTLLGDDDIARLNLQYLQRDYPPDVLSFALRGPEGEPAGDIYIGLEQALRQAAEHAEAPATELARLAIHGTLHVLGYDHPEGPERTESEMWRRQEAILREVALP